MSDLQVRDGVTAEQALAQVDAGWRALAEARTVRDFASVVSGAELLRHWARKAGLGLRAQNEAAMLKVEAQAGAGGLLATSPKNQGGYSEGVLERLTPPPTLAELGVTRFQSYYWQKVASVPEETRQEVYRQVERNVALSERDDVDAQDVGTTEVTTSAVLRHHQMGVHGSSEEDEWLTPPEIVAGVLEVLGAVDLDPCSNTFGHPAVPAARRFTEAENGLTQAWRGRVYMNPPYGAAIGAWVEKLRAEHADGNVSAAIALVPARTDTAWFATLRDCAVCFVRGRLRFSGADNSAPFPSVLAYFGDGRDRFVETFGRVGDIWVRLDDERR